jgi:hypothetical protein
MKTNIKLTIVSTFAALALTGCGKNSESTTPPPATNAVPSAPQPAAPAPSAAGAGDTGAGAIAPSLPQNTNNPAGTNQ